MASSCRDVFVKVERELYVVGCARKDATVFTFNPSDLVLTEHHTISGSLSYVYCFNTQTGPWSGPRVIVVERLAAVHV
ncbi:hypothetical protein FOQG_19582 [Fusarium oxysporum f. sp. raphani 54005]|uniref:Uncharacterized protein n=2 Tax=Fusarium oxysporum TaxID=5507 RepID=X0BA06_FUSOX|nr:hypothetical protein FOVG_13240 [Fusarium oxysporum f. sp. pisi HDV247]EXK75653.1 hypothetical protein FOQG_19582 [Fusarium oxysporum f. sp. raphani 54005]